MPNHIPRTCRSQAVWIFYCPYLLLCIMYWVETWHRWWRGYHKADQNTLYFSARIFLSWFCCICYQSGDSMPKFGNKSDSTKRVEWSRAISFREEFYHVHNWVCTQRWCKCSIGLYSLLYSLYSLYSIFCDRIPVKPEIVAFKCFCVRSSDKVQMWPKLLSGD